MDKLAIAETGIDSNGNPIYSPYAFSTNYKSADTHVALQINEDTQDGTGSAAAIAPGIVLSAGHVLSKVSTSQHMMLPYDGQYNPDTKKYGYTNGDIAVGLYDTSSSPILPMAVFVGKNQ